jgi:hypothetical protein
MLVLIFNNADMGTNEVSNTFRFALEYILAFILLYMAIYRDFVRHKYKHEWHLPIAYLLLLAYVFLHSYEVNLLGILGNMNRSFAGIACFLSCEYLFSNGYSDKWIKILTRVIYIILTAGYAVVVYEFITKRMDPEFWAINDVYYILPLLIGVYVLGKNKRLNIILLALFTITIISQKRGAILIAVFVCLIMKAFTGEFVSRNKTKIIRNLVLLIFLMVGLFFIMNMNVLSGVMTERFATIGDGSGRRDQIEWVIGHIMTRGSNENIFGYGFYASYSMYGLWIHNDWLQIFFDLGLVGLTLYGYIHYALIEKIREYFAKRSIYASSWLSLYAICLGISFYENFSWMFCLNVLFIMGCIIGLEKSQHR